MAALAFTAILKPCQYLVILQRPPKGLNTIVWIRMAALAFTAGLKRRLQTRVASFRAVQRRCRSGATAETFYLPDSTGPSPVWSSSCMCAHATLLAASFRALFGRELVPGVDAVMSEPDAVARVLWAAPHVIASHGIQPDPVLNYGNSAALKLWDLPWEKFTCLESKYTAEPMEREARSAFMQTVLRQGFVDGYEGIRVSSSGQRFRIRNAIVWNVMLHERRVGQAVVFDDVKPL
mmetsp:Transcript_15363/g.42118  ORF Transcript_15363/g.42118 Transcript_15363/m.42118 type:complete len:235 (-) Transcript_15363:60-764(-)